jgi:hypothetical protein
VGYRWFQTLSVLFVPKAFTVTRKNPEDVFPGAFRRKHRPDRPGRCGCLLTYAAPPAGLSNGSGMALRPFPFW